MASHFSYLTLRQSSTNPKNIDARFSKSLMRTNGGAGIGIAKTYSSPKAKVASKRVGGNLFTRKASGSNFVKQRVA